MNLEKRVYLACDTAYEQGIVTLFDKEDSLYEKVLSKKMSHGGEICHAIRDAVNICQNNNYLLAGVFAGLGPGSFVGARIALATALGFTFAKSLPLMGFCSHLALAYSQTPKNNTFFIYMKASGNLGYLTRFFLVHGNHITETTATTVVDINEVLLKVGPQALVYTDQKALLNVKTNNSLELENLLGPTAIGIRNASMDRIDWQNKAMVDESDIIKPKYIKPPSVSLPKKKLVIGFS